MTPLPTLAQAFPRLAAQIDTERPLIARAIADHVTVEWEAEHIRFYVSDASSFQLLSTSAQHSYLIALCSTIGFDLRIFDNSSPQPTPETKHQEPETTLPRRYNTLTFQERMKLQSWMQEPDNTHFVAHESDTDAARQASKDLDPIHITSANIGSMRKILRIEKVKPEKPATPALPGIDLITLTARVEVLETQHAALVASNGPEIIAQLRRLLDELTSVDELTSRLAALETATA